MLSHNAAVFARCRMTFLAAAVVMLAGCAGPGRRSDQMTPLPPLRNLPAASEAAEVQAAIPPESSAAVVPDSPAPAEAADTQAGARDVAVTRVEPPALTSVAVPSSPPVMGWVDLAGWLEERGLPPIQRSGSAVEPVFEVKVPGGVFAFVLGSRNARWKGVLIGIGYAPRMLGGRLQVHGIDLEKSLVPLLEPEPAPPGKGRTVVIDPGHGGSNRGALSVHNGRYESEFTLDWGRRLQVLLETNGWQVVMTRTNDVELDLPSRVAAADRADADLFLSLHFNTAAPDPSPTGLETYCVTPVGLPSNLTRGYADPIGRTAPNNAFDAANLQCAARIHRALVEATGAADRGVRRARFMDVLGAQRRAAVLVEGGFLSNPRDARLIAGADYRQKLARAVAAAVGRAKPPVILAHPTSETAAEPGAASR